MLTWILALMLWDGLKLHFILALLGNNLYFCFLLFLLVSPAANTVHLSWSPLSVTLCPDCGLPALFCNHLPVFVFCFFPPACPIVFPSLVHLSLCVPFTPGQFVFVRFLVFLCGFSTNAGLSVSFLVYILPFPSTRMYSDTNCGSPCAIVHLPADASCSWFPDSVFYWLWWYPNFPVAPHWDWHLCFFFLSAFLNNCCMDCHEIC